MHDETVYTSVNEFVLIVYTSDSYICTMGGTESHTQYFYYTRPKVIGLIFTDRKG